MKHVIIIGGGIGGLTAAYYLKKAGFDVTVLERNSYVGGAIKTVLKRERYLLELGPNTFLSSSDSITNLSQELHLDHQFAFNKQAGKKRYLYTKKGLQVLPTGPKQFLKSPILSIRGRMRVLLEPLIRSKSTGSESLASFVARRAGKELLEAMVDPFVSGVYAGDPYQLEIKSIFPKLVEVEREYGSIFKGMKQLKGNLGGHDLLSYYWGMQTLPSRLQDVLQHAVQTDTSVESIEQLGDGKWKIHLDTHDRTFEADAVVIATPASEAARLLMSHAPKATPHLMSIPYVSLGVAHTVYRRNDIPTPVDGFGFLIPRREKVRMLGALWSSSLFPNRAPQGEVLLTNYIGGATDPHAIDLDDHELSMHVRSGLEQTMGIRAEPRFSHITRINQAIPQYTVGHADRLAVIGQIISRLDGIFLTGSYLNGISVANTIEHAHNVARSVRKFLYRLTKEAAS